MNFEANQIETARVENLLMEAIRQIEKDGGDLRAFAFNMTRAGAELTARIYGLSEMNADFTVLAQFHEFAAKQDGES